MAETRITTPRSKPPRVVIEQLLEKETFVTDKTDTIYHYNGAFFEPLWRPALRALLFKLEPNANGKRRQEFENTLKAKTYDPDHEWGRVEDWEVPAKNGVVDVLTGAIRPHDPADYLEKIIPHDYKPGAECPHWHKTLEVWFGDGQGGEATALQEFFGYIVLSHAKYKKALVLYGPGDTGKSLAVYVAQYLVGPSACCSLSVEKMDDEQACAVLVGKSLNIMTELSADAMIADGGFKRLVSTEEPIPINEKYKVQYTYTPTAKHLIATNALPKINDRTEATLNRLLIVPMTRILSEEEKDEKLRDRILEEMQGVLAWAIAGARRLVKNGGQFTPVDAGIATIQEIRNEANPVRQFLAECMEVDTRGDKTTAIPLQQLAAVFNRWNTGSRKVTPWGLGKMLRAAGARTASLHFGKRHLGALIGFRLIRETRQTEVDVWASALHSDGPVTAIDGPEKRTGPGEDHGEEAPTN